LAHRINCELHDNFISIFDIYGLKSLAWNEINGVLSAVVCKLHRFDYSCLFRGTFSRIKRAKIKQQLRLTTVSKRAWVARADDASLFIVAHDCQNLRFTCSSQDVYVFRCEMNLNDGNNFDFVSKLRRRKFIEFFSFFCPNRLVAFHSRLTHKAIFQ
jgi:hypothetical protein